MFFICTKVGTFFLKGKSLHRFSEIAMTVYIRLFIPFFLYIFAKRYISRLENTLNHKTIIK